jgi:hypothetical protein
LLKASTWLIRYKKKGGSLYLGQLAELAVGHGKLAQLLDCAEMLLIIPRVGLVQQSEQNQINKHISVPVRLPVIFQEDSSQTSFDSLSRYF